MQAKRLGQGGVSALATCVRSKLVLKTSLKAERSTCRPGRPNCSAVYILQVEPQVQATNGGCRVEADSQLHLDCNAKALTIEGSPARRATSNRGDYLVSSCEGICQRNGQQRSQ